MTARNYNSYHTNLKLAVKYDLLPKNKLTRIPASTLHRFKKQSFDHVINSDLDYLEKHAQLLAEISKSQTALKVASAISRISAFVKSSGLAFSEIAKTKIPEIRKNFVSLVRKITKTIPKAKVLQWFGLSAITFGSWSKSSKLCQFTPFGHCRKIYPNQLTPTEIKNIKSAYSDITKNHWPLSSIAWDLIHTQKVSANPSTIIAYAKQMGLVKRSRFKKPRQVSSIVAERPDQVWHMDATIFRDNQGVRHYLQFVMDNFSRKILAWRCSTKLSGITARELLEKALQNARRKPDQEIHLIVDGGSENNNSEVESLLSKNNVKKFVAQVDVRFSNSMIEAMNKTIKYHYIFKPNFFNSPNIQNSLKNAINDYHNRPLGKKNGLTPNQSYENQLFDKKKYKANLEIARKNRLITNKQGCELC